MLVAASLVVTAVVFVFVCGANDGGALLSLAITHRARSRGLALVVLCVAVAAGPALFGLAVADTFTDRLFVSDSGHGDLVFLSGAVAATALVLRLTSRGVPTSITLALLGSLSGAAVGLGASPAWRQLGFVLAIGAAAPVVGAALGYLLGVCARYVPGTTSMSRRVGDAQLLAYTGQCLAYAANDGQKMFAVAAVAASATGHAAFQAGPLVAVLTSSAIALVFAVGSTVSLRRIARGATSGMLAARPWHVVSAEMASSVAVLGTSGLGVPVSMTQSTAGGLVGAALSEGRRRVRWQFTMPLLTAWVVTLPAGFVIGLASGLALQAVLTWNGVA